MQVSIKWLKDYIDFDETPEQLADMLTMAGVPVENIHRAGEGIENVVTGKITAIEKHPDADKLCVCALDVNKDANLTIVTGATNVRVGQVVPVALVGAKLPDGMKIAKGKLRGVASYGMLCSASELKLDMSKLTEEAKSGIYILPPDTPLGVDVKEVLGLDDVVLEFELTANRADCFSVLGLAREVAALTGKELRRPVIRVAESEADAAAQLLTVKIEAPDLCDRFSARVLKNVKIFATPDWIKERLESAGIRSINNVVDVTNFVMVELGQPMHAYDYDTLAGRTLIARRANKGERLTTLDNVKRETTADTLVIADAVQAAGLAGVMGGLVTEVTDSTQTVVLEAAAFNGVSIRRTSRACGLHSEASGRFERGVDVVNTVRALDRAAQLLQEMGACTVCEGVVDVYPGFRTAAQVKFTAAEINARLGSDIAPEIMADILRRLEFDVNIVKDEFTVTAPSWRNDVRLPADISEEIARIYGFNNIKTTLPWGEIMPGGESASQSFAGLVRRSLQETGLNETISFSFTHPKTFDKLNIPSDSALRQAVPVMNPITDEFPLLRTTLVGSVLETVARNLSRKNEDVRIFELGTTFSPKALPVTEQPVEKVQLAGALTGRRYDTSWNQGRETVDFYDAKGIVEILLAKLGVAKYMVESGEHYAMHPGKTAVFKKGREVIAYVGEAHPQVLENMEIVPKTYIFEADMDVLFKYASLTSKYQSLPKYPAVYRDLAITVARDAAAVDIEKVIGKAAGSLLKELTLFDVYTGQQIAADAKSMAFSLKFQSADKTLTDEEIDAPYQAVIAALEEKFQAKLRA